eukprot:scaffold270_cov121-Isochrysis_galbana.AAC.22
MYKVYRDRIHGRKLSGPGPGRRHKQPLSVGTSDCTTPHEMNVECGVHRGRSAPSVHIQEPQLRDKCVDDISKMAGKSHECSFKVAPPQVCTYWSSTPREMAGTTFEARKYRFASDVRLPKSAVTGRQA